VVTISSHSAPSSILLNDARFVCIFPPAGWCTGESIGGGMRGNMTVRLLLFLLLLLLSDLGFVLLSLLTALADAIED
jgi:hypothetical protein